MKIVINNFTISLDKFESFIDKIKDFFQVLDLKKKVLLLTFLVIGIIALSYFILYQIRFQYDSNDVFFKNINYRATKMDDYRIFRKLTKDFSYINFALTPPSDDGTYKAAALRHFEDFRNHMGLTPEYVKNLIMNNNQGLTRFYKVIGLMNDCTNGSCFAKNYTDLYDKPFKDLNNGKYTYFKLADGSSYAFKILDKTCDSYFDETFGYCGYGYVDINGTKGPNQLGEDLYDFNVILTQYFILRFRERGSDKYPKSACLNGNGSGCFIYASTPIGRTYLNKKYPMYRSKINLETIPEFYDSVYLTNNLKLVFFNRSGYRGTFWRAPLDMLENFHVWFVVKTTLPIINFKNIFKNHRAEVEAERIRKAEIERLNPKLDSPFEIWFKHYFAFFFKLADKIQSRK